MIHITQHNENSHIPQDKKESVKDSCGEALISREVEEEFTR